MVILVSDEDKGPFSHIEESNKRIKNKMDRIKNTIAVISGKGGVGKTTVSVNLASALAVKGCNVGILDIDITGPNVPMMLGVEGEKLNAKEEEIMPVTLSSGLKVVSMSFLLQDPDSPVIWRGPMKMQAIRQFLGEVSWGDLDYLIIDLPPGTGDEALSIAQLIPKDTYSIVVTTPQDVALMDSRKAINFSKKVGMKVQGIVENMSGLICPHCQGTIDLFKTGGGERASKDMDVPFLGSIPIGPEVVRAGDEGEPLVAGQREGNVAAAFHKIVERVLREMKDV